MRNLRWGIIGTGNIAHNFASDFKYSKTGTLKAVASRYKENADKFANNFNIEFSYFDYYSLINSEEVDVIYIATPHSLHYEIAKACLLAGKSILCEKPLCINFKQSKELTTLALKYNVFLMEAMWTRFNPVIEQLLEWVESGDIGRLTSIQASFSFVGPTEEKHRLLNKKLGGGALLDVGIYPVFLAQLFLGRPDFIQNQAVIGDTDVDVFEQILLGWEVGSLALLEASIISSSPNQAIISGTNGYIIIESDWVMSKSCKLVDKNKNEHFVEFDYPGFGYQFEIDEVNRCIEEGLLQSPNFSWQNSLDLIQTLDEIRNDIGLFYDDEDNIETMDIEEHHHEHSHHKH